MEGVVSEIRKEGRHRHWGRKGIRISTVRKILQQAQQDLLPTQELHWKPLQEEEETERPFKHLSKDQLYRAKRKARDEENFILLEQLEEESRHRKQTRGRKPIVTQNPYAAYFKSKLDFNALCISTLMQEDGEDNSASPYYNLHPEVDDILTGVCNLQLSETQYKPFNKFFLADILTLAEISTEEISTLKPHLGERERQRYGELAIIVLKQFELPSNKGLKDTLLSASNWRHNI